MRPDSNTCCQIHNGTGRKHQGAAASSGRRHQRERVGRYLGITIEPEGMDADLTVEANLRDFPVQEAML